MDNSRSSPASASGAGAVVSAALVESAHA